MADLFSILAGGLSVLNGVLSVAQKMLELLDGSKKGKNKRSTRKNSHKNP